MSGQNYCDWAAVAAPGMRYPTLTYSQWMLSRLPSTTRNWRLFLTDVQRCRLKRNQRVPWESESIVQFMERFGLFDDECSKKIQNGSCRM